MTGSIENNTLILDYTYTLPANVVTSFASSSSGLSGTIANNALTLAYSLPASVVKTFTSSTSGLSGSIANNNLALEYVLPTSVVKTFSSSTSGLSGSIANNNLALEYVLPTSVVKTFSSTTSGLSGTITNNNLNIEYTPPRSTINNFFKRVYVMPTGAHYGNMPLFTNATSDALITVVNNYTISFEVYPLAPQFIAVCLYSALDIQNATFTLNVNLHLNGTTTTLITHSVNLAIATQMQYNQISSGLVAVNAGINAFPSPSVFYNKPVQTATMTVTVSTSNIYQNWVSGLALGLTLI